MSWLQIHAFPAQADLSALSQYLQQLDIPHRFTDELQQQILWVPDDAWRQRAQLALATFAANPQVGRFVPTARAEAAPSSLPGFTQAPLTYCVLVLCVLGYGLISLPHRWVLLFHFLPFPLNQSYLAPAWHYWQNTGEYWRLLTPTFIHLSFLHIVFNSLWMLELGKRLEHYLGLLAYSVLLLFLAIGGNFAQFLWTPNVPFGGVSSVLYGLLGFIAVMQRFDTSPALAVPRALINFMIAWIVVGLTGILDSVIGPMANGGHIGGLVLGVLAAGFYRVAIWPLRRNLKS